MVNKFYVPVKNATANTNITAGARQWLEVKISVHFAACFLLAYILPYVWEYVHVIFVCVCYSWLQAKKQTYILQLTKIVTPSPITR